MEMQGSRQLHVTQQQAWHALNDPDVLKQCIPGCDRVERSGDDQYAIGMAVKIGPVAAKFNGRIALSDIVAPESYTLAFDGQGGAAGHGKGSAQVKLAPADDPALGCVLAYTVSATVGGKIAQLGQRLVDGAARSIAEDFFKRFDDEMQRRYPPVAVAATVAAGSPMTPDAIQKEAGKADGTSAEAPSGSYFPNWAIVLAVILIAIAAWVARGA